MTESTDRSPTNDIRNVSHHRAGSMAGVRSDLRRTRIPSPRRLTVITDEDCELCRRCRGWLSQQTLLVAIEFLPVGSEEALRRYGSMGNRRDLLIVADDQGRIWTGPDAFVMCLWATAGYRSWARWAARPGWRSLARVLFGTVSSNRHRIAELMSGECRDERCEVHQPPPSRSPLNQPSPEGAVMPPPPQPPPPDARPPMALQRSQVHERVLLGGP
jgi:predicted DCC family thiol-disulfide oxidoreductase YuxK